MIEMRMRVFLVVGVLAGPFVRAHGGLLDDGAYAELRDRVGHTARLTTTRHFVVAHDAPIETVRRLTARLEATYISVEKFCAFNDIAFTAPDALLEVLLFDSPADFYRYADGLRFQARGLSGFYDTDTNRSAFFNTLNHPGLGHLRDRIEQLEAEVRRMRGRKLSRGERTRTNDAVKELHRLRNRRDRIVEKLNRTVVQHEVAHHLLYVAGVHAKGAANPSWLAEGLACLFETPPSSRGAGLGVTNQMRLGDFREACGETADQRTGRRRKLKPAAVRIAHDSGRFMPLRGLIGLESLAAAPDDPNLAYHYAQAWGLTFYLQRKHPKKLAEYVSRVSRRDVGVRPTPDEEIELFESIFGPLDERFERRWAAFVLNLRFTPDPPVR